MADLPRAAKVNLAKLPLLLSDRSQFSCNSLSDQTTALKFKHKRKNFALAHLTEPLLILVEPSKPSESSPGSIDHLPGSHPSNCLQNAALPHRESFVKATSNRLDQKRQNRFLTSDEFCRSGHPWNQFNLLAAYGHRRAAQLDASRVDQP